MYALDLSDSSYRRPIGSLGQWVVPTQLRSLSIYVDRSKIVDILANLIKASAPSLHRLSLCWDVESGAAAIASTFSPAAKTLRSLEFRRGASGSCETDDLSTILATLPGVQALALPLENILEPKLARVLRRPVARLVLDDSLEVAAWELIAFLSGAKLQVLELSRDWWARQRAVAEAVSEEDGIGEGGDVETVLDSWWREIEGRVSTFRLV